MWETINYESKLLLNILYGSETFNEKTEIRFDMIFNWKELNDLKIWILNKYKILETNADIDVANGMEGGNISPSPGKHPEPLGKIRRWQPAEYLTIS